jgi:hypothetical protein
MGTPGDRSDLQSVINFFATPLIVDVLLAIRDGRLPRQSPDLSMYGDAVDAAITALVDAGTVAGPAHRQQFSGEPLLILTTKGDAVCALIDEVFDFEPPERPVRNAPERANVRWPIDRSFREIFQSSCEPTT